MSLRWYINRIRSMSVPEIAFRVVERVRRDTARNRLDGWEHYPAAGEAVPVIPGLKAGLVGRADPAARQALADEAARILGGDFAALGVVWPKRDPQALFPASIWVLDPVTGGYWPGAEAFCFDIPYRHERRLGDVKYVWEFNRLQFLQVLAAHHALTGDTATLAAIETAIESWFEANPPYRGIAWNSGIELALRAISLLVVASFCEGALKPETVQRIRRILRAHGAWMARFPSRFSSANNHLVAEAAGEFLIGLGFSLCGETVPEASALEASGRKVLEAEARKQILPDGVPAEQSPTYGAFTAEFLLLSLRAAREAGRPFSDSVSERLDRFAGFIAVLAGRDGSVPAIGDDDEGHVIATLGNTHAYATSVAASICSDKTAAGTHSELRNILFGAGTLPDRSAAGLVIFPEGGYSVIRETRAGRRIALTVDHGPLGYLAIAAHGHADALSFTLSVDDEPIFVDPGTYLYHAGDIWRSWFRGTLAHNTLAIAGADQSIISGPFNWSHKAKTRLDAASQGPEWSIRASTDGYESRFGVRHARTISAMDDRIRIEDALIGALAAKSVTITFLLAPGCRAEATDGGTRIIPPSGRPLMLACNHAEGLAIHPPEAEAGWFSRRFGEKEPTTVLRWAGTSLPEGLAFDILLEDQI